MIKILTHYTKDWEPLAEITIPVMREYADSHNYELSVLSLNCLELGRYSGIEKINHILDEYKPGDTFLVLDVDCLITNLIQRIEDLLDGESIQVDNDINGINTGVILIQFNDESVKDFFIKVKQAIQIGKYNCEQDAISDLHSFHSARHNKLNFIPYHYYYPSFGKIGYKEGDEVTMPTHEQGNWQMGDFICHLPGKSISERIDIFKKLPIVR